MAKPTKGSTPAGGKDPARDHARKNRPTAPKPAVAAGGKDLAREAALRGKQDGMGTGRAARR